MQKVTITKIYTTDKDKQGNPLKSKKGYPYTRMSIKCAEHGDNWISGFKNKDNENWKEGDTVEIVITENGEYLNFEVPEVKEVASGQMDKILIELRFIREGVKRLLDKEEKGYLYPEPNDERPAGQTIDGGGF